MGGKETYSDAPEILARPHLHGRPGDVREPVPVDVDAVAVLVELENDLFVVSRRSSRGHLVCVVRR